MEIAIAYNEFLYRKRREKHLSKRKFAKFLKVPSLFYSYYENGYVKPGKKYAKRISEALGEDFSKYLEGVSSYPSPLAEKLGWFEKLYKKILAKAYIRIIFIILFLGALGMTIFGFARYNYVMDHAYEFYNEDYLTFVNRMREKGDSTISLLHEISRPEIHSKEGDRFVSISASSQDYALRNVTAYVCYTSNGANSYYIVPNDPKEAVTTIAFQYIDSASLIKYSGSFTRENTDSKFVLGKAIYDDASNPLEAGTLYDFIVATANSHIDEINVSFTTLIKEKLDLDYDFYNKLLVDRSDSAMDNLYSEVSSLGIGIGGVVLTGCFLFSILFALFFGAKENKGRKKKSKSITKESLPSKTAPISVVAEANEAEIVANSTPNDGNTKNIKEIAKEESLQKPLGINESNHSYLQDGAPIARSYKTPKTDIRFFPFVPETVYEIIGILLVFLGSVRIAMYAVNLFSSSGIEQSNFETVSLSLFMYFTVGMFLLYFIDFDIFLNDKRSLRNFFSYGIVFFGLYIIEATIVEYFALTRGVAKIAELFYVIPNNFSTIACYFGIMVFLFYNPDWMNTKKKTVAFRCLAILPLLWIFVTTLIFQNYKKWGINFNTWQVYFFNSERPQFSLLCCCYLFGLFFLRLFFEHRFGKDVAKRYFNGNKFYFMKNILVCVIIAILALLEFYLAHSSKGNKGLGGYWEIIYLVPMLLFYHPHFGKRNKPLDYFTLILYGFFFGVGYLLAGAVVISSLFLH